MTAAKGIAFDMARLDGLVRAASFLALGALRLAGALAARRMGAFGRSSDWPGPRGSIADLRSSSERYA